jgi:hypothetical protein
MSLHDRLYSLHSYISRSLRSDKPSASFAVKVGSSDHKSSRGWARATMRNRAAAESAIATLDDLLVVAGSRVRCGPVASGLDGEPSGLAGGRDTWRVCYCPSPRSRLSRLKKSVRVGRVAFSTGKRDVLFPDVGKPELPTTLI